MYNITNFIHALSKFDYLLLGGIVIIFLIILILGIVLRKKNTLSIFLVIFSFIFLLSAPIAGYFKMHELLYKHTINIKSQKKLTFSKAVVIYGTIINESKLNFKSCTIKASIFKKDSNKIKNFLYQLKPFKKRSVTEKNISKKQTRKFKIIIEPFLYEKEYDFSVGAICR
jgi:hypothetical protein